MQSSENMPPPLRTCFSYIAEQFGIDLPSLPHENQILRYFEKCRPAEADVIMVWQKDRRFSGREPMHIAQLIKDRPGFVNERSNVGGKVHEGLSLKVALAPYTGNGRFAKGAQKEYMKRRKSR